MRKYIYCIISFTLLLGCAEKEIESFNSNNDYIKSMVIPSGISGTITKTNSEVIVPVKLLLDAPASRAFQVEIALDNTKLEDHLSSNMLDDAVIVSYSDVIIPNAVSIEFGAEEAYFLVKIARTAIERGYGKKAVLGYTLKNPGKGNFVDTTQYGVVEVEVKDIISLEEMHYLSIFNADGRIITAANRRNYSSTAAGLTIALTANLASTPGKNFTVNLNANNAYVQDLINSQVLPANTVILPANEYSTINKIYFPSNTSQVGFDLNIGWNIVSKYLGKKIAVCLELASPTMHLLDPEQKMIVAVVDPASVLETDVTNQGVLSVSRDHTGGANNAEGSSKLVDNNLNTKFYQASFVGDLWCQLRFATPQKIGSYSITSANNLPTRDPRAWYLSGSNDGVTWAVLDTQGPIIFEQRAMTKRFNIAVPREFSYYRLYITENAVDANFQVAEWRLLSTP